MSSKIKVDTIENVAGSGNVSLGSGHNLVVPGDLTVDTNTLKVDSSNNRVGIGTASPSQTLETAGNIFVNTSGNPNLTVKTTSAGNNPFVRIQADTNYWDLQTLFSNTNDELDFRYNGNSKMMIDKEGRVTKPLTPAFKQGVDNRNATGSDRIISGNAGDTFSYQARDNHNVGSHWNSTTGRFTCPVAGTYMFYCSLMRNGNNGTVLENRIKKNGAYIYARAYAGAYTAAYQQSMLVTTTICAVNDYIEFFLQGTSSIYQDDTYLGGYLLG